MIPPPESEYVIAEPYHNDENSFVHSAHVTEEMRIKPLPTIMFGLPILLALIFAYAADPGSQVQPAPDGADAEAAADADASQSYRPAIVSTPGNPGEGEDPFRGGEQHRLERELYRSPETRESIVSFYTDIIGSRGLARIILKEAYRNDVPFSLAAALAYVESSFDPRAVNVNHASVDRGLFQLNNRSFPELSAEEFFDPETNAEIGLAYLRWCLRHGENDITALAMYNAGRRRVNERGAPKMTLTHISKILSFRSRIEERFDTVFTDGKKRLAEEEKRDSRLARTVDSFPAAQ